MVVITHFLENWNRVMNQWLQAIHDVMKTTNSAVRATQTLRVLAELLQHLQDPRTHLNNQ